MTENERELLVLKLNYLRQEMRRLRVFKSTRHQLTIQGLVDEINKITRKLLDGELYETKSSNKRD